MEVQHDGIIEENDYVYGMISNSLSVAGLKSLAKRNVVLDDGLFEVTLIKMPADTAEFGEIAGAVMNDRSNDFVSFFKTREISFFSKEPVSWTLDGEFGGSLKKVRVRNNQKSLAIMVSADAEIPRLENYH